MDVIPEQPGHAAAVRDLNRQAFGGHYEAELIDRLRNDGLIIASLIAVEGEEVRGHILFSRLPVTVNDNLIRAAALAPMCVRPDCQRQGIGTTLVHAGIEAMGNVGIQAVIVLGHPAFYPRFGFSADAAKSIESPFTGEAFMALELVPGILRGKGKVTYPPAFGL